MSARDLPEHIARAAALFDGLTREFLAPPPILTVTEWAERHRIMSAKDSAEPGPYRIARSQGCRFYLGSDAHHPAELQSAQARFEAMLNALELDESEKFHFPAESR